MWQILTMNIFLSEHKSSKQHYHCWYSFIKFVSPGNLTSADRLMLCWPMRNAVHCVQKADSFKDFKGLIVGSFSHCTSPLAPSPSYSVLTLVQLSHVCTCNACFANHIRKKPIQKSLDCSQSPIFSWDRLDIPRLTVTGISWFSNVPRGRASGIIAPQ